MKKSEQSSGSGFTDLNFQSLPACRRTFIFAALIFGLTASLQCAENSLNIAGMEFRVQRSMIFYSSGIFLLISGVAYGCYLTADSLFSSLEDKAYARRIFVGSQKHISTRDTYNDFAKFREICRRRFSEFEFDSILPVVFWNENDCESSELGGLDKDDFLAEIKDLGCPEVTVNVEGCVTLRIGRYEASITDCSDEKRREIVEAVKNLESALGDIRAQTRLSKAVQFTGRLVVPGIAVTLAILAHVLQPNT